SVDADKGELPCRGHEYARIPRRRLRGNADGGQEWLILPGMLLGAGGASLHRRCHEPHVDRGARNTCAPREDNASNSAMDSEGFRGAVIYCWCLAPPLDTAAGVGDPIKPLAITTPARANPEARQSVWNLCGPKPVEFCDGEHVIFPTARW